MLTLLVAWLLIYKFDLPHWVYVVAIALWAVEAAAWCAPKIESSYLSTTS
jgi:hypothetical protein